METMHTATQTETEWLAEVAAAKARRAAVERRTAADWAHINALIARAAAEDAAARK
jgi:hypothetical protein